MMDGITHEVLDARSCERVLSEVDGGAVVDAEANGLEAEAKLPQQAAER